MKSIIHIDMDAFFASVEQHDNPSLRGRPVMVGGGARRGVVAAASYEARQFGVRSAMPGSVARRLCPQGIFVPSRFARYREVSGQIFAVFHELTDHVEGLSLDEAFLDVSMQVQAGMTILDIGRELKRKIGHLTGLTASVGMAHNKLLAKLASDYDKPDGFVHVAPEEVRRFLDPLPVRRLWGIGPKSTGRLHDAGIFTVGQLRKSSSDVLSNLFGPSGPDLRLRAAGIDERPVKSSRVRRSISQETTFDRDLHEVESLTAVIIEQAQQVAATLVAKQLHARTVTLKLRSAGFSTITRSESLPGYTRDPKVIAEVASGLLTNWAGWRNAFAVRLIGVGVSGLVAHPEQADLI
ncbi:MAG: DNA polymerase IV [Wenzhouxiangella sp.]